jgi:hypothetical protein
MPPVLAPKPLTVDEFLRLVEVEADKFKEKWQEGQRAAPKNFPKKLTDGDWWEQFLAHIGVMR